MTPDRDEAAAEGQAMSRSDVSEIPDLPIRKGEAVFFPRERATQLGDMAGFDPSNVDDSRYATFRIDESQVIEFRGVVANIDAEGRFPVDVPVGDYLVCLANTFPDHTTGPPYTVVGCDVIELHDSADLIVSFGEGGVEVSLN